MPIPGNVMANADDFGLNNSINKAIVYCFDQGYINSTSLITNCAGFEDSLQLIHTKPVIKNIGIHINFAEGKPLTNIDSQYLDVNGNWDISKTSKKIKLLSGRNESEFLSEIHAQINKAIENSIAITHLDSHFHLHTLPCFYKLFIIAAKTFKLKLRLAQTYQEDSYYKYLYRMYINNQIIKAGVNYSVYFETINEYLKSKHQKNVVEVMLHPDFDEHGNLTDHVENLAINKWLGFIENAH